MWPSRRRRRQRSPRTRCGRPRINSSSHPVVALLTDFGLADGYVGVMKGVTLGIEPGTQLVDLTHEIPPQDIGTAAWVLHTSWRAFPDGTIFLCVVDPGVGSERASIALRAGEHLFVGPDNGLFSYVLREVGPVSAVTLDNPRYHLPHPSATFHGRDIFAPAAGHLAAGIPLDQLGTPLSPEKLVRLSLPIPMWRGDLLVAHVLHVDHFGNLITDLDASETDAVLADPAVRVEIAGVPITARARTFAEALLDTPALVRDSSGHLAIVLRDASAATLLDVRTGAEVLVRGLPSGTPPSAP